MPRTNTHTSLHLNETLEDYDAEKTGVFRYGGSQWVRLEMSRQHVEIHPVHKKNWIHLADAFASLAEQCREAAELEREHH